MTASFRCGTSGTASSPREPTPACSPTGGRSAKTASLVSTGFSGRTPRSRGASRRRPAPGRACVATRERNASIIGLADLRGRCVMTTWDPDTRAQDVGVLRDIARRFDGRLCLNAAVLEPGRIEVGDVVELLGAWR